MTDSNLVHRTMGPGASPAGNRTGLREQVREIIQAEVSRFNPTDDARRALELIIESSLRYTQQGDGRIKITVVDRNGQPRTVEKNGHTTEFTLQDLLEELRAIHPVLFKSSAGPGAEPNRLEETAPAAVEQPNRDWLSIGSDGPDPAGGGSMLGKAKIFDLARGKVRLPSWSRGTGGASESKTPESAPSEDAFQFVPYGLLHSAGRARHFVDGLRERPLSRRRGFALGATAAVALLLGLGAFALFGQDESAPQAGIDEPVVTGAVSPAQPAQAPVVAASSNTGPLRGVPDVIDTATLSLGGEVVRLFGVEWAPGGGKPDDLTGYLQGREVTCQPAGSNDTYRCQVGEQDLSRVVLFNGGGKPTPEATPELKAAADRAREAKIGVWNQP